MVANCMTKRYNKVISQQDGLINPLLAADGLELSGSQ